VSSTAAYKPGADEVKRLREATGAGMIECRNALVKAVGDFAGAKSHLIERGQAALAKKAERSANEGLIGSYIHAGGKIGVLVELNCETDFVARNERFGALLRDIAIHIAAMSPRFVDREAVPAERFASLRKEFHEASPPGKSLEAIEALVEAKLEKWCKEHVLLDQPFVKDDSKSVRELLGSFAGVLGENIRIRRFVKFALRDADRE
jgi:elongation factor Ts